MNTNIGMTGEFRCVVKKSDGSTKIDTGYQKNLILDQGLDFFGGGKGTDMVACCVIGSGNSQPSYTQNKLDAAIKGVSGSVASFKYDYDAARDGNLYKTNIVCKYSFTGLNNVNISEVGLASNYSNTTTYYLCTRALIKDSQGNPTTITVLSGEILEVYYKLWAIYDTTDKTGQINVLDGAGNQVPYNYKARLMKVGDAAYASYVNSLSKGWKKQYLYSGDLVAITGTPSGELYSSGDLQVSPYVLGSYKSVYSFEVAPSVGNGKIRTYALEVLGCRQIRFGSVANDSPIVKTDTQTLTIPVEVSWGRYEGAL